jgi:hypothetical protein
MGRKSQYGNLVALSAEWTAWTINADTILLRTFGNGSFLYKTFGAALAARLTRLRGLGQKRRSGVC